MTSQLNPSQRYWQNDLRSEYYSRNTSKKTQGTPKSASSTDSKSTAGSTPVTRPKTAPMTIASQPFKLQTNRALKHIPQIHFEPVLNQCLLKVKDKQRHSKPVISRKMNTLFTLHQKTSRETRKAVYKLTPHRMPKHKFLLDTPSSISIQSSSVDEYTSNLHSSQSSSANQTALEATQQVAIKLGAVVSPSVNIFNTNQTTANPAATAGFGFNQADLNTLTFGAGGSGALVPIEGQSQQNTAKDRSTKVLTQSQMKIQNIIKVRNGKKDWKDVQNSTLGVGITKLQFGKCQHFSNLNGKIEKQAQALAKQRAASATLPLRLNEVATPNVSPVIKTSEVKQSQFNKCINFSKLTSKDATAEQKPVITSSRLDSLSQPKKSYTADTEIQIQKQVVKASQAKPQVRECIISTNPNGRYIKGDGSAGKGPAFVY